MIKMYLNNDEILASNEFTIVEPLLSTPSVILNNVMPKTWDSSKDYVSNFYYPLDYSILTIGDYTGGVLNELYFTGLVKNTGNISLNPRYPKYTNIQALGFKTYLSEGDTLDYVIYNKTLLEALQMVIDSVADYGFQLGNYSIPNNTIIGAYSTLNKTPYDVIQYLADISQSKWWTRSDGTTTYIDFYNVNDLPKGNDIEYTTEYFETNNIIDINWNYGTRDYRNKQIMLSSQVYGGEDYIENIYANGFTNIFYTTTNIGEIKSITTNGITSSFATQMEKETGVNADYYYTPGSNELESDSYLSSSTSIQITYTPLVEGREIVINSSETQRIKDQTTLNGIVSRYEIRNDATSSDELLNIGESYLEFKGSPEIILNIETQNKKLCELGYIYSFDAPLVELKQNYMCKEVKTRIVTTGSQTDIFYTFKLTSSYNGEEAVNYFDNQRNKSKGNLKDGQYITRNVDIENVVNIVWQEPVLTPMTVNGDNILENGLEMPLNN